MKVNFLSIYKNLGANSLGFLINLTIQFLSVPIFIKYWGVEMYGEWLVLTAVSSYFAMTDMGLSTVTSNEFSISFAAGEHNRCRKLINNNFFLF